LLPRGDSDRSERRISGRCRCPQRGCGGRGAKGGSKEGVDGKEAFDH